MLTSTWAKQDTDQASVIMDGRSFPETINAAFLLLTKGADANATTDNTTPQPLDNMFAEVSRTLRKFGEDVEGGQLLPDIINRPL